MNNEFNGWGDIKPVKQTVYNPWNPIYKGEKGATGATGPMGPPGINKAISIGGYFSEIIESKSIIPWQYISFSNTNKILLDGNNNLKIVEEGTYFLTQTVQINSISVTDAVIALYLTNNLENFDNLSINLINPGIYPSNSNVQYNFTTVFNVKKDYLNGGAAYLILFNGSNIPLKITRIETTILELG